MQTHELARALESLAKFLRSGPNVAVTQLANAAGWTLKDDLRSDEIKIGLSHLVALSRVDKRQWIALIEEHNFPIPVRNRDASRDILGKLLRYLEKNPEARQRLSRSSSISSSEASPELMKALSSLLKD